MSWRSTQLNDQFCDQDRIILELFKNKSVRYVGNDYKFAQHLSIDNNSNNLVLIINDPMWISELCDYLINHLAFPITTFYVGINRYQITGNDTNMLIKNTDHQGENIIKVVDQIISKLNYKIIKQGSYDNDRGRYFNFVQPLTWIYGLHATDKSN
jgi:hypothetical protein